MLTDLTEHELISEGRRHVQLGNDGFSISLRAQTFFFCLIVSRFSFLSFRALVKLQQFVNDLQCLVPLQFFKLLFSAFCLHSGTFG